MRECQISAKRLVSEWGSFPSTREKVRASIVVQTSYLPDARGCSSKPGLGSPPITWARTERGSRCSRTHSGCRFSTQGVSSNFASLVCCAAGPTKERFGSLLQYHLARACIPRMVKASNVRFLFFGQGFRWNVKHKLVGLHCCLALLSCVWV